MAEDQNRGPWIIAGAILVAAVLVVGFLIWSSGADCRNWQKEAGDRLQAWENAEGERKTAAGEALVEIADEQPNGCADPR